MIWVSDLSQAGLGEFIKTAASNGYEYGIDGMVAGVALGILGILGIACIRDQEKGDHNILPHIGMAMVAFGAQYGGIIGITYGIGKTVLQAIHSEVV